MIPKSSLAGLMLLAACAAPTPQQFAVVDTSEVAVARRAFEAIQPVSLRENVEYCGAIGRDRTGRLVASQAARGRIDSCMSHDPSELVVITASYHTHGGYSPEYFNELPSMDDVNGDLAEGIDGYVATPGGRIWFVDTSARRIRQICGLGCLPQAANFVVGSDGPIQQIYSFAELAVKLGR